MTREELKQEVQKWVNGADRYQMNLQSHLDHATDEIMKLVDNYVLSCVMKATEFKENETGLSLSSFPILNCPLCGSTNYNVITNSGRGNCQCQDCKHIFFYNFYNSI